MTENENTITIHMDQKCAECHRPGAMANAICMSCTSRALQGKPMKSEAGKVAQKRAFVVLDRIRKR